MYRRESSISSSNNKQAKREAVRLLFFVETRSPAEKGDKGAPST
nr:MAG TPA: hypothetical protein [Caudoviricetes sp.]